MERRVEGGACGMGGVEVLCELSCDPMLKLQRSSRLLEILALNAATCGDSL